MTQLPPDVQPTLVFDQHLHSMRGAALAQPATPPDATQWWYELIKPTENGELIVEGIRAGAALWVTEGLYKAPYGSIAFTLLPSLEAMAGITLVNQTPGRASVMDAYRVAEAGDIYGCVTCTNELLKHHQLESGSITMACDCKSALLNIFDHEFNKPAQVHYMTSFFMLAAVFKMPAQSNGWPSISTDIKTMEKLMKN
jgi:hypothetical protein